VLFTSTLQCGGAERVTANLANYWVEKGWDITIVTIAPLKHDFYTLDSRIYRFSLNKFTEKGNKFVALWQNICVVFTLRQVLNKIQPDIALSMMISSNVHLALATLGMQIRTVGSERFHPPELTSGFLWERLRRYTYGQLDAVTALTTETAKWLKAHTYARRVSVICNAISWPIPFHSPELPTNSACHPGRKILLAVGRLEEQKGFDLLISAFSSLQHKCPEWDLVILGEGTLRSILNRQIQDAELEQRVFLPGKAGNVGEWYARADLYVMSSRFEGFPNTLVEALSYRLPAVSFDCNTGPRDIIRNEIDGLLVVPEDVVALARALGRLMGDEVLRKQYASRAVEAKDRFSMNKIDRMWTTLFEGINI